MEKLKFFDVKERKSFETENYKIIIKNGRKFAVADCREGHKAYRILGKA